MRFLLIATIFFYACASVQNLDGGEKDIVPPKVVATTPDSAQLYVSNPLIVIQFDEYIKTKNTSELLIISPSQQQAPTINVKGKKVFIQLNDSLIKNTTYSINFNGCIVDFNEGNPMDYFKYVFSTGSYIDSFSYKGKVVDVTTNKPCEKCNVQLYKSFNDSIVLSSKPTYIIQTAADGRFVFNNLPADSFLVYAIQDENKNLILNDQEYISISKRINTKNDLNDSLTVFPYTKTSSSKPKLTSTNKPGILQLAFPKPVSTLNVQLVSDQKPLEFQFNRTRDTITSFYFPTLDTTNINLIIDTFNYQYFYKKPSNPNYLDLIGYKNKTGIQLKTNYTIDSIHPSKITVIQDSAVVAFKIENTNNQIVNISTAYDKSKKVKIEIDSGFISDFYGNTNKSDTITLIPQLIEKPLLDLTVNLNDTFNYIIQLISSSKIIKQYTLSKSQKITIENLNPGLYEILLIQDINGNNIWDSGNPFTRLNPETRIISETFEMRLNWDKELTINSL